MERAIIEQKDVDLLGASVRCKDGSYRHIEFHLASFGDSNLGQFCGPDGASPSRNSAAGERRAFPSSRKHRTGNDLDGRNGQALQLLQQALAGLQRPHS